MTNKMNLHRHGVAFDRKFRNDLNENWDRIEGNYNNVIDNISEEAFEKVIDGSKLDWSQMVDTVNQLPSNAKEGDTRGVKADNKIYRFDGSNWIPIAEINLNPIAEVDNRLSSQLAQKAEQGFVSSELNRVENIAKTSKVYQDRIPLNEISASRLKTTSQEDRIKLVNLHEEVLQAMAGNTPVNSIPANGSVTLEKLAPQLQSIFIAEGESW